MKTSVQTPHVPTPPPGAPSNRPQWRQELARRYPHWELALARHLTRSTPPVLTRPRLASLVGQVSNRLGESRAAPTWSNIASVVNQFTEFDGAQVLPQWQTLPLEERMIGWVEMKINDEGLSLSSAILYCKKLHQIYRMLTTSESFTISEYARALARNPNSVPDGARELTTQELGSFLAEAVDPVMRSQVTTMWLTASRADDLNRLTWEDIEETDRHFILKWDRGTKSGTAKRADFIPKLDADIDDYLRSKRGSRPFPYEADAVTTSLRTVLSLHQDSHLSSHSIKKGALVFLLTSGMSISQVMFKAKHATEQLLQTYVGPLVWAEVNAALESSVVLMAAIDPRA